MLKYIVLVVLLTLVFFLYGLAVGYYRIFPFSQIVAAKNSISESKQEKPFIATPDYLHKKTFFELDLRNGYDIVFIGDSITDNSDWYDFFPNQIVANRGIGNDTTTGVLNRMDTIVNTKAEKAFIMIGVNDIIGNMDVETIVDNYKKILDELQANSVVPIVQSTLLTYNRPEKQNQNINKLNAELKAICLERNIIYVDLNKHLSKNGMLSDEYSYDGLHLNGNGYSIWAKEISKYIE